MKKLQRNFYNKDTLSVAKNLLGKILVHTINGKRLSGRIVETEAYKGITDKAAHSYGGRRTKRTEVMYGPCGFSYVYMIYGMYYCFNIVTEKKDIPEAVLIRAVEPLENLNEISLNRYNRLFSSLNKTQIKNLTNGPGKLCKGLAIGKTENKLDLYGNTLYIAEDNFSNFNIKNAKRIGISYAQEAVDYPWRFYIENNIYVSVK
ncbi:DNA-3-methyladenine glycosylase [Clostridium sp. HV4-5-A1G]|uniref:DNA-3-methyladenine glycosylase n=1 Tax=Clostridium sp. HV4-5-A1G TaxID=2004595 RepID=UPI00123BA11F|nr:DNA-3-methyladenine glycosylase [Clostridium sp. HV4-5-A1G]KAA8675904.1 DNA-3-methyladenine glycosylase [Clostridium sp. HV4-5-A1G]CAB1254164.1 Putative 3-methyladenine DNA glycosylase [Clostridiaceae bacterium BL-3]